VPEQSQTPLHVAWWLADDHGGRVRVEIRRSPESPPLVQTFGLTSVPAPEEALVGIARAVVAAINGPRPAIPTDLALSPDIDRTALDRIARVVAARFAPLLLGPAVAGDGVRTATWQLRGERGELDLAITMDPDVNLITALTIIQRPPIVPQHGD
jgi:hypothetical protein